MTTSEEFNEDFEQPERKLELFNILLEMYLQYRDKSPDMKIAAAKKDLQTALQSPHVTRGARIKSFASQVAALKIHAELIQFLRLCLLNFNDVFAEEIAAEQKKGTVPPVRKRNEKDED